MHEERAAIIAISDHAPQSSVITSKAANGYHVKTGQQKWPSGTEIALASVSETALLSSIDFESAQKLSLVPLAEPLDD